MSREGLPAEGSSAEGRGGAQVERHLRRFLRRVDKDALDEKSISQAATLKLRESELAELRERVVGLEQVVRQLSAKL